MDRRALIAESYLDHIAIALKVGDKGAPFRTFIDNWYAFETGTGHLTDGDRPIWFNNPCARTHGPALRAMHFQSLAAAAVLDLATRDGSSYAEQRQAKSTAVRLMVDHAVPLRVIVGLMFEETFEPRSEAISAHLRRWYRLGVITSDEDARLNSHGLRSAMPTSWNGHDVYARYAAAGVVAA
ncbi:hypothetical protein [Sphingomonas flavescens]|uniref:hypothetical protein n=1 Tax=Sphingomonas flavescens TaxID=3132797 RepID=UPI002805C309|nr:hypothetical protein [Sphingomonas limnosediminicola]